MLDADIIWILGAFSEHAYRVVGIYASYAFFFFFYSGSQHKASCLFTVSYMYVIRAFYDDQGVHSHM